MKKFSIYLIPILLIGLLGFILFSCAIYPDISGDWQITNFCDPEAIGIIFSITQEEGNITVFIPILDEHWNGSIDTDGNVNINGCIEGDCMTFTGMYTGGDTLSIVGNPGNCTLQAIRI